jgi:hypothetical protein
MVTDPRQQFKEGKNNMAAGLGLRAKSISA